MEERTKQKEGKMRTISKATKEKHLRLHERLSKDKTVFVQGFEHTADECPTIVKIGNEWFHCVKKHHHKGQHMYAYGTGYRGAI
jgi:hypothetical protein